MRIRFILYGMLFALAAATRPTQADPVWYYLYAYPVPPEIMQKYTPGPPGSDLTCLPDKRCGIKASIVLVLDPGINAHPVNEEFADWRACQRYARTLARFNAPGFRLFCYGTDGRAFW